MSFFGGSQPAGNTTTTTSSAPWAPQQPYLQQVFQGAQKAYNSGGPQYYPSSTYSPITAGQTAAQGQLQNLGASGGNSALNAANGSLSSMLSPSYLNGTQPGFNTAQSGLTSMASGATTNPFTSPGFQNVVNGTLANVIPATSASFINGGRSDSGLAQAAQTAAATNAVGSLANQNYTQEQQLQQGAQNLLSNNYLNQQGNQVKAGAIAPMVDQQQSSDMTTGLNAAGLTQQNNQNQLNANVQAYNYNQMLPYNNLGMYNSLVQGNYGGTGATTSPYFQNQASNILGGATGLLGLNGLTGSAGGGFGSTALGSLFALSDRRLKDDIHKIGESDSGFPIYTFRYKADPGKVHIGLMAQDVMKKKPDAVEATPFGWGVNYTKALAT